MTTICLVATDQLLSVAIEPKVASGDQNSVELHVDFDSKWDRYGKSAVFFTADGDTIYEIPLIDGECVIPHEVLANPGILYIGIRGVNADNSAVKTSSLVKYKIAEGAPAGDGTTVEPTADVYQQIMTAYKKTNDALAVERARINQFTALAEGSTTGDAELMDIRVDCYGVTHENAGTAVRSQFAKAIATLVSYNESTGLCNWNAGEILDLANNGRSVVFRTDDMQFIPLAYVDRSIARFDRIVTTTADGMCVETIEIDADGFMTTEEHPIVTDSGAIIEEVAPVIVWHDPSRKCSHTAGEISELCEAFMNGDKYNQIFFLWHGSWLLPLVQADGYKAYFERTMLNEDGKPVLCSIVIDDNGYFTKTDTSLPIVDNSKIGADVWSSKNIIDKLCPSFTESGAIVTCEPVEGYPLDVAWESKNLFSVKPPSYSISVPNADGSVANRRGLRLSLPAGTYTISVKSRATTDDDKFIAVTIVGENGAYKSYFQLVWGSTINTKTFTVETDDMICLYHGYGTASQEQADNAFEANDIQIEKGATATAYEPYAETATITRLGLNLLPYPYANTTQTTNGIVFTDNGDGSITANGTATADATFLLYNGNLKYPFSTILGVGFSGCPSGGGTSAYYISNEWCGLFDYGSGCQVAPTASSAIQTYWCSHFQIVIKKGYTANNLVFKPCLYYGYQPKVYVPYVKNATFNPGETIPALPGVNTIFADVGEVTVSGKADPVAIINKLVGNV